MSSNNFKRSMIKKVLEDPKKMEFDEEWNNFMKRMGEVGNLVRDLASGDKDKAEKATILADQYLEGKVIHDENVTLTVKADRTLINQKAFDLIGKQDSGQMDKETFMDEMTKDANKRAEDRKIRREKAETFKTMAMKAYNRGEYQKALCNYNKAIEQVKDNAMLLCDRALTNIKLGNFEKVFDDCYWALRLNENSFKARLYRAKAYKELGQLEKFEECMQDLNENFSQHKELIDYFIEKKMNEEKEEEEEDEEKETDVIEI